MSEPENPFSAIAAYHRRSGLPPLNQIEGCWEVQVDEQWWFALNGHPTPLGCSKGYGVLPYHLCVEYNGWPAGVLSPTDGGIFAAGSGANVDTFIAALTTKS